MLTCNSYTDNTVQATQTALGCTPEPVGVAESELPEEQFLLTVLDALIRAGVGTLEGYDACDGVTASRNAFCAITNITPQIQNPPAKIKAAILYILNEANCP